ncbi:uncharacterized protein LOC112560733 [Pomacea canaliculata]|uniref:uncharacterized protein LOC112560733 n=1 Tax=Pomacea canaliculata TaxID=400727 RepID=UPI000D73731C|nr:uncharacterized protein LOC112560733 [Pomacea canaliculata]
MSKTATTGWLTTGRLGSSTVVMSSTENPATLVLRHKVKNLQEDTESYLKDKIAGFKDKIKDKSSEEINEFISEVFDEAKNKVVRCFDDMKAEVKSHAPKPPKRQKGESDYVFKERETKYERETRDYKTYVATTASIMSSIMEVFTEVLIKVKEFFNKLWTWIKQFFKDIGEKIASFIKEVKETINEGLSRIFGW